MKNTLTVCLFLLFLLPITTLTAEARQPAVEPVRGISIDDYKKVPPGKDIGFDFSQNSPELLAPLQREKGEREQYAKKEAPTSTNGNLGLIAVVILTLPFAIYLGLMRGLTKEDDEIEIIPNNTIYLNEERSKRQAQSNDSSVDTDQEDEDDDDIAKAS